MRLAPCSEEIHRDARDTEDARRTAHNPEVAGSRPRYQVKRPSRDDLEGRLVARVTNFVTSGRVSPPHRSPLRGLDDYPRVLDGDRSLVQVERVPLNPSELGAAHAGAGSEDPDPGETVIERDPEPCRQFVERPATSMIVA